MSTLRDKEILIIDDSKETRLLVRKIIESDGGVVSEAASIAEGLAFLQRSLPHLVLLDLNFPESSNGFDFLAKRKETPAWQSLPVIVFTGASDKNTVVRAGGYGISGYLVKPFRAALVLQKIRKALRLGVFLTKKFEAGKRLTLQVSVPSEVKRMSEIGLLIDATAKFAPDEIVRILGEDLKAYGIDSVVTKVSSRNAVYNGSGRYLNEILFSGVGETFTKNIRKLLKRPA